MVYLKDKNARLGKPIEINSRFGAPPRNLDPKEMLRFVVTEPPTLQSHKMIVHVQSANGVPLTQTWKFSDSSITVENQIKKYPISAPAQWVCTFIKWPQTHTFAPNVEKAEREKATAGYSWRAHSGKTYNTLKTITVPYAHAVEGQVFDWLENRGPWGTHEVVLRRKTTAGHMGLAFDGTHNTPCDGLEMVWASNIDPKAGRMDTQTVELTFK